MPIKNARWNKWQGEGRTSAHKEFDLAFAEEVRSRGPWHMINEAGIQAA